MMKKIAALLAALLTAASAAACGGGGNTPAAQTAAGSGDPEQTDETAAETAESFDPMIEAADYGGKHIGILTPKTDEYCRLIDDISAETEDGNALNDAIYRRNSLIMEKYNVVFDVKVGDVSAIISKSVKSGSDDYGIVLGGLSANTSLAADGNFIELGILPHIDMEKPYWSRAINEDIRISGRNFFGVSDLTIQAYFASGIVYFNKALAKEYQLRDPYQTTIDGRWTLDELISLSRAVSGDVDGNGVLDEKDRYGITFNNFAWQILFYGSGETFVKKDDADLLVWNGSGTRLLSVLQKLMPISQDQTVTLYSENYKAVGGEYRIEVCRNAFNEGRALMWLEAMYGVPALREMENDFGILPVPKFDEAQESYGSFVHTTHSSSVAVPTTIGSSEMIGAILEDLTYQSSLTVRPAFIETTLKGKYARDNDSEKMIDLIIGNIRTDYGLLLNSYGLGTDSDMRRLMDSGSSDASSVLAKNEAKYLKVLEKYNDIIRGIPAG